MEEGRANYLRKREEEQKPSQELRLPALNTSETEALDGLASSIEGCGPQYLRLGLSLRRCAKY